MTLRLSRITIAAAFSIAAVITVGATMLAQPAGATCYGPSCGTAIVAVTGVNQASNGVTSIDASGSHFFAGESVQLGVLSSGKSIGAVTASSTGTFSVNAYLPAGLAAGEHELVAYGTVSGKIAHTFFHLARATGNINPCPKAAAAVRGGGVVLAAFVSLTPTCLSTLLPTNALPSSSGGGLLPLTGTDAIALASLGAVVLGGGGLLVLVSRRRRHRNWVG